MARRDAGLDLERACLVALALAPGIGPRRLASLLERFGGARETWRAPAELLAGCAGLPARVRGELALWRTKVDPADFSASLARAGLTVVTSLDGDYPPGLRSVPDHPPVLCVRGDPVALTLPAVAVVGTRKPTPYGLEITENLAAELASAGVTVVSGLALGIDGAAHLGAIRAGGRTVAVLGSGHRKLYPPCHAVLARDMVAGGGAVISQFGPDTLPVKGHFIARNRVVAGMCLGVVVTEAPAGSGALSTAGFGRLYGRVVMAVPGPVTSPNAEGCLDLLRAGALAVGSAGHVLAAVGLAGLSGAGAFGRRNGAGGPREGDCGPSGLSGDHGAVLRALGEGELVAFDRLLARTGLSAERLGAALGILEVRGLLVRRPGNHYAKINAAGGTSNRPPGG